MTIPDDDPDGQYGLSQAEIEERFDHAGESRDGTGRPTSVDLEADERVWEVMTRRYEARAELTEQVREARRTADSLNDRFEARLDEATRGDATESREETNGETGQGRFD